MSSNHRSPPCHPIDTTRAFATRKTPPVQRSRYCGNAAARFITHQTQSLTGSRRACWLRSGITASSIPLVYRPSIIAPLAKTACPCCRPLPAFSMRNRNHDNIVPSARFAPAQNSFVGQGFFDFRLLHSLPSASLTPFPTFPLFGFIFWFTDSPQATPFAHPRETCRAGIWRFSGSSI